MEPTGATLYVMAVEAEYGPCLRERIVPLFTGVGPVEAAVAVTAELTRRSLTGTLPDLVVCLGSAGSRTLEQGAVYQASSVSYRDIDATALGFAPGETPFADLPTIIPLPFFIAGIAAARLSTGGNVVSGAAYDAIDADMVDMETFAVLRACQRFDVALIGLRGISDGDRELSSLLDWSDYLGVVDKNLADAVDRIDTRERRPPPPNPKERS